MIDVIREIIFNALNAVKSEVESIKELGDADETTEILGFDGDKYLIIVKKASAKNAEPIRQLIQMAQNPVRDAYDSYGNYHEGLKIAAAKASVEL